MKKSIINKANIARVLKVLWLNEGISRIEIAEKLGLDKSTITNIVNDLKNRKIIIEIAEGRAGPLGGRRPIKLKIAKNYCAILGIEVQPDYCEIQCVNLSGEVLVRRKFSAVNTAYSFKDLFIEILEYTENELDKLNISLAGIGLGFSGIINPVTGIIHESIPLGVTSDFNVIQELSAFTDIPIFIDNDANCCCFGELLCNRDEGLQDFLFCLVEFRERSCGGKTYNNLAVGIGIVIRGRIHHGQQNTAGEFRSIFAETDTNGQLALEIDDQGMVLKEPALFEKFAVELSRNLALLANTFALTDCFIGGELGVYKREFPLILKKELNKNWNYPGESLCRARYSSIGDSEVSYGAAAMIIDRIFTVPGLGENAPEWLDIIGV